MTCSLGCSDRHPAVVMATLRGKFGTAVEGVQSQYALCTYHYQQIKKGDWANVTIIGEEQLPPED